MEINIEVIMDNGFWNNVSLKINIFWKKTTNTQGNPLLEYHAVPPPTSNWLIKKFSQCYSLQCIFYIYLCQWFAMVLVLWQILKISNWSNYQYVVLHACSLMNNENWDEERPSFYYPKHISACSPLWAFKINFLQKQPMSKITPYSRGMLKEIKWWYQIPRKRKTRRTKKKK